MTKVIDKQAAVTEGYKTIILDGFKAMSDQEWIEAYDNAGGKYHLLQDEEGFPFFFLNRPTDELEDGVRPIYGNFPKCKGVIASSEPVCFAVLISFENFRKQEVQIVYDQLLTGALANKNIEHRFATKKEPV